MTKEYHIDYNELAHGNEYESEFMERHIPGPSCAVRDYIPEDEYHSAEWELLFYEDLKALGLKPGEHIWIEIDY